ncbi:MAG: hypothetical protein JWO36_4519 [Myxococcales bacterium]|nr:hypothetical protein [Myxococcales bacterium]
MRDATGLGTLLVLSVVIGCARDDRETSAHAADVPAGSGDSLRSDLDRERPFLDENAKAMAKMMADMDLKPTGDVDRDFVAMMAPHHQAAIDMATAELRYGRNEQLKRLAQEIIVKQHDEIAAMHRAIGEPAPPTTTAPPNPAPALPRPPMSRESTTMPDHPTR